MNPIASFQILKSPAYYAHRLDETRANALEDVLAANPTLLARAREASAAAADDAEAARALEEHTRCLLDKLRQSEVDGRLLRLARWADERLRSDGLELLDREDVPSFAKRALMRVLHAVNVMVDSYAVWARAVDHTLSEMPSAHLYDLAAGTGGFARYLASRRRATRAIRVTSSDLDLRYVEAGAAIAKRKNLAIDFEARNVLDLRGVGGVDLFVCTQATHHLTPGQVVRMIAGAVDTAPRGILIIDLERSFFSLAMSGLFLSLFAQPLLHDGLLSVRRSYAASELRLLARIAGASSIVTSRPSPTYTAMHACAGTNSRPG